MVFVLGECSQLHAVSLQEVIIKGEPLEMTAGGWVYLWELQGLFRGADSRAIRYGRRRVPVWAWEAAAYRDCRTAQRSRQQVSEITEWTSLGSKETGKVQRSSKSYLVIQSYAYRQGSVSRDRMGRGESCLWNCFISYFSDVFTLNFIFFYTWKLGYLYFTSIYKTCPFFSVSLLSLRLSCCRKGLGRFRSTL